MSGMCVAHIGLQGAYHVLPQGINPSSEENLLLRHADAEKPDDWDDEEDGEWEPPTIPNPACTSGAGCGEWKQPTKANPAYKGKWSAPLIDNPAYKVADLTEQFIPQIQSMQTCLSAEPGSLISMT